MKKSIVLSVLLAIVFSLSACKSDAKFIGIKVESYPERLIYVAGEESNLDLDGGTVRLLLNSGQDTSVLNMSDNDGFAIIHDIDWETPGIYKVIIEKNENIQATFAIQVVSSEEILEIVKESENLITHESP